VLVIDGQLILAVIHTNTITISIKGIANDKHHVCLVFVGRGICQTNPVPHHHQCLDLSYHNVIAATTEAIKI